MKIKIGNDIINLDMCFRITITASMIELCTDKHAMLQYEPGHNITQENFNTLSAWMLNQTNNQHTVLI